MLEFINKIDEMYPAHWASMEAIKFQKDSVFAKELEDHIDQIVDYADSIPVTENAEEALAKHSRIREYMLKNVVPGIIKTVQSHTGILVKQFLVPLPKSLDSVFSVYVYMVDKQKTMHQILPVIENIISDDLKEGDAINRILDMSYSLDRHKGKILAGIKDISVKICLPIGIFTVQDFSNSSIKFSAKEITAMLLHEIGHVFAWIEYSADLSYSGYYGNNILRAINAEFKRDPHGTVRGVIDITDKAIKRTDDTKSKENLNKLNNALKAIEQQAKDISIIERSGYNANKTLLLLRIVFYPCLFVLLASNMAFIIAGIIAHIAMIDTMEGDLLHDNKRSRELSENRSRTMFERLADEYVSRYGMSKYLNTGLIKIHDVIDTISLWRGGVVYSSVLRDSAIVSFVYFWSGMPLLFLWSSVVMAFSGRSSYEDLQKRLNRNVMNTIDLLKSSDIDKDTRLELISEIEEMKRVNNKPMGWANRAIIRLVVDIVRLPNVTLESIASIALGNANLVKEYDAMYDKIDNILSGDHNISNAKLMNIFDK
jgi:hypothetical protein